MKKIAVIGGGAAGMMAAFSAAKEGAAVSLFEKNEKLGKKLFITGKGRCNFTNASPMEDFFPRIPTNSKFLYSAFYGFTNQDLISLFSQYGLRVKTERGGRVFPASDHSSDVIATLRKMLAKYHVKQQMSCLVQSVIAENGSIKGIFAEGKFLPFDAVVLATGGVSYPATGSTGDGYQFAEKLGHSIQPPKPSLVPLVIKKQQIAKELQGLALKNIGLTLRQNGKILFQEQGEMLFTHFGISGPLVLSASAHFKKWDFSNAWVELDFKPALSLKQLDTRYLRDFEKYKNKKLENALVDLFPKRMIASIIKMAGLNGEKPVHNITKSEREKLVQISKCFPLQIEGTRGMEEAIITRGGICIKEINPKTMESKKISGLYFAGELIDVDGYTGGYNLQIAFSTGYLAGMHGAKESFDWKRATPLP